MLTLILASGAMAMTLFAAKGIEVIYRLAAQALVRRSAELEGNAASPLARLGLERDYRSGA